MEVSPSCIAKYDDDTCALKCLLEAFGSLFSLEDIASAYCMAGKNADLAGQILYDMQESTSTLLIDASNGEAKDEQSSESSNGDISDNSCHLNGNFRASKQKRHPVSGGTISSVLGKDYVKLVPAANGSCPATKPLKLDAKEMPVSELWGEEAEANSLKNDCMHKDMEDFLFKMLGDGFQLERDVIRQVLDKCGYDMQQSMEKLIDLSAVNLDTRNKYPGKSTEKFTGACPNSEGPSCQKKWQPVNCSAGNENGLSNTNRGGLPGRGKQRNDLQNEQNKILAALFYANERSEELPRNRAKATKRSIAWGQPVVEPPKDSTLEHKSDSVDSQLEDHNDEEEDGSYQALRRAVKEHRATMKEYYEAAVAAFAKGDYDRANKLMEQGHFFHQKAQEADEESALKIFETKIVDTQDEILLDLHEHGAREAIRLLKCHLSSLSGISSIKYLKVIIETNEKDDTKGARRRLVMKLLGKESIAWTEGENVGTILIRLDNINPKHFSFAKK